MLGGAAEHRAVIANEYRGCDAADLRSRRRRVPAEFVEFLEANLPTEAETTERPRSVSHMPAWARRWQRLLFDNGWLLPGSPEFGGSQRDRPAAVRPPEELCNRRIYHSFNPQGVNIVAASLISFGSEEQKHRWAVPVLKGEMTASLGMSEPLRVPTRLIAHPRGARR